MMLDAMSGIDSTVAVASRSAYMLAVGRRDLGGLSDHRAADVVELLARFGQREVGAEAGNRFELVERTAGMAERAARHHRHDDAGRRDERREDDRHLVADAAGRMFVDARTAEVREVETLAAGDHRVGERGRLGAIEAVEKTRHEQRRHLVVGHVAARRRSAASERHSAGSMRPPSRFRSISSLREH